MDEKFQFVSSDLFPHSLTLFLPKSEKEKKRLKQKKEKQERKEERKANASGGDLENMIAYVDEFGNITDTPPDPAKKQTVEVK